MRDDARGMRDQNGDVVLRKHRVRLSFSIAAYFLESLSADEPGDPNLKPCTGRIEVDLG